MKSHSHRFWGRWLLRYVKPIRKKEMKLHISGFKLSREGKGREFFSDCSLNLGLDGTLASDIWSEL